MRDTILAKLDEIEKRENIKILHCYDRQIKKSLMYKL